MSVEAKILNESGFPLQIAVQRAVAGSRAEHPFSVKYVEHSWHDPANGGGGFVDLVLAHRDGITKLIVECKRARDANWVFVNDRGHDRTTLLSKCWVTHYDGHSLPTYGWRDLPVDPLTPEALYCATRGMGSYDKATFMERICGELIHSTEGIAAEERDYRPAGKETVRCYFNVVVTTAKLSFATFADPELSLEDGTLASVTAQEVPYLRMRKQFSLRTPLLTPDDYTSGVSVARRKENVVFIVSATHLIEFLKNFEVSEIDLETLIKPKS